MTDMSLLMLGATGSDLYVTLTPPPEPSGKTVSTIPIMHTKSRNLVAPNGFVKGQWKDRM